MHTLRVFTNLIQIPTLVLDDNGVPVAEKTRPQFQIAIDHGKPFNPTHVHLEGDDAISLAVLMDASGREEDLVRDMPGLLGGLVPALLTPRDHVSLYAVDCALLRTLNDAPADSLALQTGAAELLKLRGLRDQRGSHCRHSLKLYDALTTVLTRVGESQGRRIVLLVSDGKDDGSRQGWHDAMVVAHGNGVAIFDVSLAPSPLFMSLSPRSIPQSSETLDPALAELCRASGGLILPVTPRSLKETVERILRAVRGRYILEFPRDNAMTSGTHLIEVKVVKHDRYTLLPAGATVTLRDPRLKDDPTVLQRSGEQEPAADAPAPVPH